MPKYNKSQRDASALAKELTEFLDELRKAGSPAAKSIANMTTEINKLIMQIDMKKMDASNWKKQQTIMLQNQKELQNEMRTTIQLRNEEARITAQAKGEEVRKNIILRKSLEDVTTSFDRLNKAIHGLGFRSTALGAGMGILGQFSLNAQYNQLVRRRDELQPIVEDQSKVDEYKRIGRLLKSKRTKDEDIFFNEFQQSSAEFSATQGTLQKESFKNLEKSGWKRVLDWSAGFQEFLSNHKKAVGISLVSMGLFIGLLKKMFEASPILGKMFDLFKLMFDLVIRPFGDMVGMFLLPILKVVMASVLPWFQEVYPKMLDFGLRLGNILTNNGEGITFSSLLEALGFSWQMVSPLDIIAYIFGQYKGDNEELVSAVSAGSVVAASTAGTGLLATAYLGKKAKNFLGNRGAGGTGGMGKTMGRGLTRGVAPVANFFKQNPAASKLLTRVGIKMGMRATGIGALVSAIPEIAGFIAHNLSPEEYEDWFHSLDDDYGVAGQVGQFLAYDPTLGFVGENMANPDMVQGTDGLQKASTNQHNYIQQQNFIYNDDNAYKKSQQTNDLLKKMAKRNFGVSS